MVGIRNLTEQGQPWGSWTWTVVDEDGRELQHMTNREGEGVFVNDPVEGHPQVTGTCQFSLRGCSRAKAYNRLRRFYE